MKIVSLSMYEKQVKRLLTSDEREAMESNIAANPLLYPVIPGTGGFRKVRWARGNRGKSGGVRAIFYYYVKGETIYLVYVYPKSEQENLTNDEKKYLKKVSAQIDEQ